MRVVDRTALTKALLAGLDKWYQRFLKNEAGVVEAWKELNITLGEPRGGERSRENVEGLARGVDAEGRLILKLDDGTLRQVTAGDVTILNKKSLAAGGEGRNWDTAIGKLLVPLSVPESLDCSSGGNMLLAIDIGNSNVVLGVFDR